MRYHTKFILFIQLFALPLLFLLLGIMYSVPQAYATVSVTTATGGSAISADTTGGSYTTLTGPVISQGATADFPSTGTLILSAPTGFIFNTGQNVTATITRITGTRTCFTFTSTTATPTSSTITFTINAATQGGGSPATTCRVTFSNIQVRPSAGTPLASGDITRAGTATITGLAGGANLGTLTEIAGTKSALAINTQPSSSNTIATDFTTKPIVAIKDQFGNTVTSDSSSTITRTVVLSTQICGGTAGSGALSSTPNSGAAVTSGLMTYSAMQYSVVEGIKICFSSSGITSVLSNTVTINPALPTVTTQAASSVTSTTATSNGNITGTGGSNNDVRGFVYDTTTRGLPGNVAPGSSGYASYVESSGSYGTGAFTNSLTGLTSGQTYYGRAYSHNSTGYSYGNEVSFTTPLISITITSDGVVSYGTMPASSSKNTTASGLNDTQTAKNDGNVAEDFNIRGQNSTNWTLGASAGSDQYTHEFSTNSGSNWTALTTNYQALISNLSANSSQNFDLRISTPTSSTSYTQQSVHVVIQAVQH